MKQNPNKRNGKIYTPEYLVKIILNFINYNSENNITKKHIIDNSCGDGAFLSVIVDRYCKSFLKKSSNLEILKKELSTYIHGIEIDEIECKKCIKNLSIVVKKYNINDSIDWDIICEDTLRVNRYDGKMDYVVGNPPYVRIHNLSKNTNNTNNTDNLYNNIKQFSFSQYGMTDLFIVFFEISFKMLSKTGKMSIITPSSWLTSKAGQKLRKYILEKHNLSGVIDLEHFQAFDAITYTLISRFNKNYNNTIEYNTYNGKKLKNICKLTYDDILISNSFYFSTLENLEKLKQIRNNEFNNNKFNKKYVIVKNGFATLADKIFIGDFNFSELTIDVIKASTGKWQKCIFPYNKNGKPLTEKELSKYKTVYNYLLNEKDKLTNNRDININDNWFLFGRTQAIKDVFVNKISINSIIKDISNIKISEVNKGCGVYSGLYILTDISFHIIKSIILNNEFIEYLQLLKNYKNGGYYTLNSKDLELFINYKLNNNEKFRIPQYNSMLF